MPRASFALINIAKIFGGQSFPASHKTLFVQYLNHQIKLSTLRVHDGIGL